MSVHRGQHDIDSLSTGEFCRRNKISVCGDQNNLIYLPFVWHCRNIQAEPHIDSFLDDVDFKVVVMWLKTF